MRAGCIDCGRPRRLPACLSSGIRSWTRPDNRPGMRSRQEPAMSMVNPVVPSDVHVARGAHSSPTVGTCLMELVSVIGGERFSDRPKCVHPTLATIARTVNDHVGDDSRQRLVTLLPTMMTGPPASDPRVGPAIALSCLDTAAQFEPGRLLSGHRRRVLHHLHAAELRVDERRRLRGVAWLSDLRRQFAVFRAVATATGLVFHYGDDALVALLNGATEAASRVGTPPTVAPAPPIARSRELAGAGAR